MLIFQGEVNLFGYSVNPWETNNINNKFVKPGQPKCGLSEESIFGPIMVLIYINGLPQTVSKYEIRLCTDASPIFYSQQKLTEIKLSRNKDFPNICVSFLDSKWLIHFRKYKTKCFFLKEKRNQEQQKILHNDL